jgi:hypothetical protein
LRLIFNGLEEAFTLMGIRHSFPVPRVPLFVEPGRQNASYWLGMAMLDDIEEEIHHSAQSACPPLAGP